MKHVSDVRLIELPMHSQSDGDLVVLEKDKAMPFAATRLFLVRAKKGAVRGKHAHKQCSQLFVCTSGVIEVECKDGIGVATFTLDRVDRALLVPPSIWASERYVEEDSVLSVLCDRPYEVDDYLRDWDAYLAWRSR
jgi:dTDP-4-dehydrorhamnose 3,5-epimerase-like enzyme